jgi:hypothetical protein
LKGLAISNGFCDQAVGLRRAQAMLTGNKKNREHGRAKNVGQDFATHIAYAKCSHLQSFAAISWKGGLESDIH